MSAHDRRRLPARASSSSSSTDRTRPAPGVSNQQRQDALKANAPAASSGLDWMGLGMMSSLGLDGGDQTTGLTDNDVFTLKGGYDALKAARSGVKAGQAGYAMVNAAKGGAKVPSIPASVLKTAKDGLQSVLPAGAKAPAGAPISALASASAKSPVKGPLLGGGAKDLWKLNAPPAKLPAPAKAPAPKVPSMSTAGKTPATVSSANHKVSIGGSILGAAGGFLSARDFSAAHEDYMNKGLTFDNGLGMASNGLGVTSAVTGLGASLPSVVAPAAAAGLSAASGVTAAAAAGLTVGNLGNQWSKDGTADMVGGWFGSKNDGKEKRSFSDVAGDMGAAAHLKMRQAGFGDTAATIAGGVTTGVASIGAAGASALNFLAKAGGKSLAFGKSALSKVGSWFGWGGKK